MQLRLSATGPVHPDEAWDRYLRPVRWAEWSPQIRRVEVGAGTGRAAASPAATITPGGTGRVWGPPGLAVDFVVDEVDEAARTWSWTVRVLLLGVHLHLTHGVEPREGGTATWLQVRGAAPVVLGYAPLARLALAKLCRP